MTQAYPLQWPEGWPRHKGMRQHGNFKQTLGSAIDNLDREVDLLGGRNMVISTNIEPRLDGRPRMGQRKPDDPGVAVYFQLGERSMAFACDQYDSVAKNIHAIGLTIGALRGIKRWGASDMMERAFTGFEQLPHPDGVSKRAWRQVFGIGPGIWIDRETLGELYHRLAKERHPDHGGSDALMAELNAAYEEAKAEFK